MEFKENLIVMNEITLPQPSSFELKGRQSVRATFKLSAKAIEALGILAVHLGIKQKSIFDHLMEDAQSLCTIAQEADHEAFNTLERVQKTFVISRKALISLEETAEKFNISRDALVELSVQRLLPIILREREKHEKRKNISNEIGYFLSQGLILLEEFKADLGDEDPATAKFKGAIDALIDARTHIEAFIAKGQMIEHFEI
jgi:predicted DNA-binding protein YlxM (UPF0122 family)